jgi:hypothetical protein
MTSMTDHGSSGVSFSDEALHKYNSECGEREGIGRNLVPGTGRERLAGKMCSQDRLCALTHLVLSSQSGFVGVCAIWCRVQESTYFYVRVN